MSGLAAAETEFFGHSLVMFFFSLASLVGNTSTRPGGLSQGIMTRLSLITVFVRWLRGIVACLVRVAKAALSFIVPQVRATGHQFRLVA